MMMKFSGAEFSLAVRPQIEIPRMKIAIRNFRQVMKGEKRRTAPKSTTQFAIQIRNQLFRDNVTGTIRRTATARMLSKIFEVVAVIESDFITGRNIAVGKKPN